MASAKRLNHFDPANLQPSLSLEKSITPGESHGGLWLLLKHVSAVIIDLIGLQARFNQPTTHALRPKKDGTRELLHHTRVHHTIQEINLTVRRVRK